MSWYLKKRIPIMENTFRNPAKVQSEVFYNLIEEAKNTAFGLEYNLGNLQSINDFQDQVPLFTYDQIKPYILKAMHGESDVLWPGEITWFATSSGTTSDKSKFIPVSYEALEECHLKGVRDLLAWYYFYNPKAKVFQGKGLIIGGSHSVNELSPNSYSGDLSAVLMNNLPFIATQLVTPSRDISLMPNWNEKLTKMIDSTYQENVTNISGVPTWTLLLLKGILKKTGAKNIKEVWPNLELYIHGGVNFQPYKKQFEQLIGSYSMQYRETYNASEGFLGIQDSDNEDMVLMLDYGIFYEFVKLEELDGANPTSYWIDNVELNVNYAVIISTNAGLWRYVLGDTIMFTSLKPHRFKITGRTKNFINAFGEELMVENAEKAITIAQDQCNCQVSEFTAGPVYLSIENKGRHEWAIEFDKEPDNLEHFIDVLDKELQSCNSDYEAKRQADLALLKPIVHICRPGTFYKWMNRNDKLGGQHKVPKLSNNRKILEEIIDESK
ncbi:MAG: GH3 auxin-responsive promoter family protein [Bacteroidia bacterium]|nr:GH3 auxin-responsive promoter family protein [Bacteroidia bacterium]NNJ56496.1 GH3 auxin-responsive promoter family protein [Bacteroidia bacterium]